MVFLSASSRSPCFGIPSALDLALTKLGVEQQPVPLKGSLFDGVKDTLREWWLVVRCSFVGVWVGIVPGLGSQVVDWLAYGHAAQTSKNPGNFGKGDVRGVIAPESANDAKDGGDLVTTLLMGFPQGVVTALFIVALLAWGYLPGPEMVKKNPDVIYSVVWLQGISGIIGTLDRLLFWPHSSPSWPRCATRSWFRSCSSSFSWGPSASTAIPLIFWSWSPSASWAISCGALVIPGRR